MSDPQPARLKPKPPRAEPLQPDNPTHTGRHTESDADGDGQDVASSSTATGEELTGVEKQKEMLENTRKNVSEGYD